MQLKEILKGVSRSFYLTLWAIPGRVRDPIGLAYLFCRAADTIADTDLLPSADRLKHLALFREQFKSETISWQAVREIRESLVPHQGSPAEQVLLSRLEDCFRIFETFDPDDQRRIRDLVGTLTNGMEMDLTCFGADPASELRALPGRRDLELYCYFVAGVVGEFWTRMIIGHFPALRSWDEDRMKRLGVHFGKGLQMTNVLKDLAKDLARGRCYVPEDLLDEFKLKPRDLKEGLPPERFGPVRVSLIRVALYHLEGGWNYLLAIPRREVRLRLACLWPHLFAIRTLERIDRADQLLKPEVTVKIPRREVYATMAVTTLLVFSNTLLTSYYSILRRDLMVRVMGH